MNESIRRNPARTGRLAAAVALLLAASAQGADFNFDIPAGDLKSALDAYVKQTGQQIVYKSDDVKGKTTPGVHGSLSDQQALDALLKGTGLQLRRDDSGAVVVFPAEAVAGGASAQGAGGEQKLEEVIVTATAISQVAVTSRTLTRIDADPMLLPMSVSAVQADLLQYQQATTIADVTANVSGVATNSRGQSTSRGFSMSNGQNGMTIGTVAGAPALPVVALDRVEVAKGPAQIMQGTPAGIGGTVNAITKVPTPDDYAFIGASAGSEAYYRFDGDVNGTLVDGKYGRLMGEVIGSTSDQDGPKDTVGPSVDYVSAGLRWTNDGSGTDLSVVYQHSHTVNGLLPVPLGGERLRNGAPQYVLGDPDSRIDTSSDEVDVRLEQRIAGTWYLDLAYTSRDTTDDFFTYVAVGASALTPQVLLAMQSKARSHLTTDIYRAGIHGQFDIGPVQNKLLLSYDYQSESGRMGDNTYVGQYITDVAAGTQDFIPFDPPMSVPTGYVYQQDDAGVLLLDQINWEQWHALVGLRWVSLESKSKDIFTKSQSRAHEVLPQVGLVYEVNPRVSLYASYNEGYTTLGGLFRDAAGNPLPDPTYEQYEGGTKLLFLDDQLALTAALYQVKQKNWFQYVDTDPETFQDIYESVPGITSKGVEIELAGQPIRGLQVRTTYAYTEAEDDTTGKPPTSGYTPNRFSLWTQYWFTRNAGNGWWAGGGLQAWDSPEVVAGRGTSPGATLFDLSAGYQAGKWQAIAGIKNVGDVQAYDSFGNRRIRPSQYYTADPVIGRQYRFDVSYRF